MSKYENGKIYRISDEANTMRYIGSTIKPLIRRMSNHISTYKTLNSYTSSHKVFDEFGVSHCQITLIEEYPCSSRKELIAREAYHINRNECVNSCKMIASMETPPTLNSKLEDFIMHLSELEQETFNTAEILKYFKEFGLIETGVPNQKKEQHIYNFLRWIVDTNDDDITFLTVGASKLYEQFLLFEHGKYKHINQTSFGNDLKAFISIKKKRCSSGMKYFILLEELKEELK